MLSPHEIPDLKTGINNYFPLILSLYLSTYQSFLIFALSSYQQLCIHLRHVL